MADRGWLAEHEEVDARRRRALAQRDLSRRELRMFMRRLSVLLVALVVFFLIRLIPGDPAIVMLGEGADPAAIAALHHSLGLDQPVTVQFLAWLGRVLSGDLGRSIVTGQPVGSLIVTRFQLTASIVLVSVVLATLIAIGLGLLAAWQRNRPLDAAQVGKLLTVFVTTLQYSYLFGLLPSLMIGAVDDILFHVKRIGPVVRVLLVGLIAFAAAELLYGSRGPDSGLFQFVMYGLVGFIPATISAWLVHRFVEEPEPAAAQATPR